MKKQIVGLLLAVTSVATLAVSVHAEDDTVMSVNGEKISKSYFEYFYRQNVNSLDGKKSVEEYLPQFEAFRLKVAEAKALGMDTLSSFKKELRGYRKQVAEPLLTDDNCRQQLVKQEYQRMRTDRSISHIFIRLDPNATPSDTLIAYKKAVDTKNRLKTEKFEDVARAVSDDPSVKNNNGSLGYLTALQVVYPLEDAIYNANVGAIVGPVRSVFGYHLIRVDSIRPSRGKVLVAHIMKFTNDTLPAQNVKAAQDIQDIYKQLQGGADFKTLAKDNSDDESTAKKGGEMGWISSFENLPKNFIETAFALKDSTQYSKPFQTPFGWHIVRILDRKPFESFDAKKQEIEGMINRSDRANLISDSYVSNLKKKYSFEEQAKTKAKLEKLAVKLNNDSVFYIKAAEIKGIVFNFAGEGRSVSQVVNYMKVHRMPSNNVGKALDIYEKQELKKYADDNLEKQDANFSNLMQEYRDGILMFNISQQEVWDKAAKDTAGLTAFFDKNKNKYTWDGPRFKGRLIYCKDIMVERQVRKILDNEPADSVDNRLMDLNKKNVVVKTEKGLYAQGDNKTVDILVFSKSKNLPKSDFKRVFTDGKVIYAPEDYNDMRGAVIQDYQNYLETEWVKNLRQKYPINVNESLLRTITDN